MEKTGKKIAGFGMIINLFCIVIIFKSTRS